MIGLDPAFVAQSLRRLAAIRPDVFGAEGHGFRLNPPLSESEVASFESVHGAQLPWDYRAFITTIGNGGAGPAYGVFPLGRWDGAGGPLEPWPGSDGLWGDLARPFPHVEAWNDLGTQPRDGVDLDPAEYERRMEAFDARYWDRALVDGAMPICHEGCAHRVLLIVTGREAGNLWYDSRASDGGLGPWLGPEGTRQTFTTWYEHWLQEALASAGPQRAPSILDRLLRRRTR